MTCLPDVNVWIALAVAEHVHHDVARHWFEASVDDTFFFCRVTQMGFLRLLTNPRVMAGDAMTAAESWRVLDAFTGDNRVEFALEPPELQQLWRAETARRTVGPNFWTDAYLAAFAAGAGHTLVSFDRGFKVFSDLRLHLLGG